MSTEARSTHLSPHRSIRSVLSLHAKVSPEKVFIIHDKADGRREELAFAEVNARAHQTANLLQEDFAAKPADHVAILVDNPADAAVFYLACWIIGSVVIPLNPADEPAVLASKLHDGHASICLVAHEYLERIQPILPSACQPVQIGGLPHDTVPYFNELVKNLPNTFFNDYPDPTLDAPALWLSSDAVLTQGELLFAAQNLALAQAFTGNQRMMSLLPLQTRPEIILALLMPLLVGGSVVFSPQFSVDTFWRHITAERAQIALVSPDHLHACLDFADAQRQWGESIWGMGVHQQDLTRFRHLICADPALDPALGKTVNERLGLAVYDVSSFLLNEQGS